MVIIGRVVNKKLFLINKENGDGISINELIKRGAVTVAEGVEEAKSFFQ